MKKTTKQLIALLAVVAVGTVAGLYLDRKITEMRAKKA